MQDERFEISAREITGGLMHVSCEYGGKSIYKNQWDLCSAEDEKSERSFVCPIERGRKRFVKQMKIPNYLPKVCISLICSI